jgi:hypothetical protein
MIKGLRKTKKAYTKIDVIRDCREEDTNCPFFNATDVVCNVNKSEKLDFDKFFCVLNHVDIEVGK